MFAPQEAIDTESKPTWWADARCLDGSGTLTSLFFSEELQDIARAKAICAKCPVSASCLSEAIDRREPWGVWGGELFLNGKVLAVKRKRGRPPKHPRPEVPIDEVPVPPWLLPSAEPAARTA